MDFSYLRPLLEHVQAHVAYYVAGAAIIIPFVYFTRRYSMPIITYTVEIGLYAAILHAIIHGLVAFIAWFERESSENPASLKSAMSWGTPLVEFWDTKAYHPPMALYIEIGLIALVAFIVLKFRPIRFQRKRKSKYFDKDGNEKKKNLPGYRDYSDLFDDDLPKGKGNKVLKKK